MCIYIIIKNMSINIISRNYLRKTIKYKIFNYQFFKLIYTIMKYLAAYALISLSGKKDINAADIKKVLGSTGANVADEDLNRLIESLKGKDINKLIASGSAKIGGSGPAPVAKTAAKPVVEEKKKQQPKKKVEKKEQPKEEDDDMGLGGGLFD